MSELYFVILVVVVAFVALLAACTPDYGPGDWL